MPFVRFQNVAKALRVGDGNFYHKSFKSHKISTFWSHSWHGGHWKKIPTLLTFYNAHAALFCGFLTAIFVLILYCLQILPGFDRQNYDVYKVYFSPWCVPSGFVVTIFVMLLWRSHTKVFFDRLCISQENPVLKAQAIFSLAGLLKNSDVMLILWDPTWTAGLWCLFELAAFLKSKATIAGKQALVVRPIFLGPISIAMFLASFAIALTLTTASFPDGMLGMIFVLGPPLLIGMVVAYPTVMTIRSYFRDLDIMKEQLLNISVDATRSSCCDQNNHLSPSGVPMPCDRKVVKECVKVWFGSQEAFEHAVRSEVLDILTTIFKWEGLYNHMGSGCHLSISMGFFGLLSHFRYSSRWVSKPLEASLFYLVGGGLDIMVGSLSSRKGFTDHDLQVYTGKREHFVHWSVQEPDGCFRMCLSSQHPLGTLFCYPVCRRRVRTCSCLVGRGFVFFIFCKHCNESDSETIRMVMENCMSKKLFFETSQMTVTGCKGCQQKKSRASTVQLCGYMLFHRHDDWFLNL